MSLSLKYKVIRDVYNQEEFDNQFYYNEKPSEPIWKLFFKYGNSFFKSNHQKSVYDHITDFVPIIRWISEYRMKYLSVDIIAGITIGILNIPQAMAYSSLAGVPAVIGLYTSFLPSLLYSIFATSKHVSIGMFAVIALMIGNVEEKHGTALYLHMNSSTFTPDKNIGDLESVQLVACLTFTIGVVLAIMAICQFHIISVYLSDALIGGFTTGAAFHVLWSQIPKMFALQLPRRNGLFKLFYIAYDFFSNIKSTNFPDVILTFICLVFLYIGKVYINPLVAKKFPVPIPFDLIVVIFSIIMSHFFNFHSHYKMSIIAHIPTGFPTPAIPNFSWFTTLLPDAIIIAIVIYAVTISVAKLFAQKHNYVVSSSQEVRALAVCQMISSFLLCMPASGGLARSTLNSQIGSKSQVTSIVSSSLMLIVILWVGPLLYDLPTCVLSAIIAIALRPMFRQFLQLELLWKTSFYDFLIWMVSFLCTVTWDVSEGLLCAIGFALLTVIIRIQCPKTKRLAKIGDTDVYRGYHQYEGYSNFPHIIIYRFDAPLLFLNCERFKTCGIELIQTANSKLQNSCKMLNNLCIEFLILDASAITNIDNMGAVALKNLAIELKQKYDVKLLIASHNKQFQQMCWVCGIYLNVPKNLFFPTIHDATIYACEDLTNINEKENKEVIHL